MKNTGYNEPERSWYKTDRKEKASGKFFCLSMFSLTNEVMEGTDDFSELITALRKKILSITDELNDSGVCDLECEVFGTFNTSEMCVVSLSGEYVDVLQILDYIKYIKMSGTDSSGNDMVLPVFLTSYSVIAIKEGTAPDGVKGSALVQC